MKLTRLVEGVVVVGVLAALFLSFLKPSDVESLLTAANPALYAVSFAAVLGWLVASSETLFIRLRTQHPSLRWFRFRVVFLGGMGVRGLIPGGLGSVESSQTLLLSVLAA